MYLKYIGEFFFTAIHSYVVRSDFIEITNSSIIKQLKESLKYHKFNIALQDKDKVTNDLIFVKNFLTHIRKIDFSVTNLEEILCTISSTKIKVKLNLIYSINKCKYQHWLNFIITLFWFLT